MAEPSVWPSDGVPSPAVADHDRSAVRTGVPTASRLEPGSAQAALARAVECLLASQSQGGWWSAEPESNSATDAEDLLVREFLGIRTAAVTDASARRIRSRQRSDGTWSLYYDGPPHVSTTVAAYLALRLAGDLPDAPHMEKAAGFVRASGMKASIWLALFGVRSWDEVAVVPPELIYLPSWIPFNIYDWACWTRALMVPMAIIGSIRPVHPLPFDVAELRSDSSPAPRPRVASWSTVFRVLNSALHRYERQPIEYLRAGARRRCTDWLLVRQSSDGTWCGSSSHTSLSLIALHVAGYHLDHPAMERGVRGLDRFAVWDAQPGEPVRRVDVTQSPNWDTALASAALTEAGLEPDHVALVRAAEWMLTQEIRCPGDWRVRRPDALPGGWPFQFSNDTYPDIDDTAAAIIALRPIRLPDNNERSEQALRRALAWLTTMQSRDGGWGAFDADSTRQLCNRLPFCDYGMAIDQPSADVTAHVIRALCQENGGGSRAAQRGVEWLLKVQEADGSWVGRWGVNHVYGTGLVLQALAAAGIDPGGQAVRRAIDWMEGHQGGDGGWGEDPRSYGDPTLRGRGTSTASQTAWAVLGLLAAARTSASVDRGIAWLVQHQRPDGNWDESQFTGTVLPDHMYLHYDLYRLIFPIRALACYTRT